ncbi:cytoskeletal adhesion-domain-containing protein [Haematococcus lacustris]
MEDTRGRWDRAFGEALDFDTWGQVEEAIEGYQRLQVAASAEYVENVLQLPLHRRDSIGKLAAALKLRVQELQGSSDRGIGLNGMKTIRSFMKQLIVTDASFPLASLNPEALLGVSPTVPQVEEVADYFEEERETLPASNNGTLRDPPTSVRKGDTTLVIQIHKWGFKDATGFVEPRVAVSVRNDKGDPVEAVQETPTTSQVSQQYLVFENTVYLQTPINRLPEGSAIFFEFKHWKAKKQKKSCKAYCFMELDEIKQGPITLEVYKKPVNYSRNKKPVLLSVKQLYLHLDLTLQRHQ